MTAEENGHLGSGSWRNSTRSTSKIGGVLKAEQRSKDTDAAFDEIGRSRPAEQRRDTGGDGASCGGQLAARTRTTRSGRSCAASGGRVELRAQRTCGPLNLRILQSNTGHADVAWSRPTSTTA